MTPEPGPEKPRRRQARGERRIAQLLDAAESVFGTVGYHAASTNAIARAAGVSPGTLYQFFPNKEAIGDALSERLVVELRYVHGAALSLDHAHLRLRELIDRAIDPLIAFNLANPVCFTLLQGPEMSRRLDEDHDLLHTAMLEKVKAVIAARGPGLDQRTLDLTADICWAAFFGVLQALFEKQNSEDRAALTEELKTLLHRYLSPLVGEDAPAASH